MTDRTVRVSLVAQVSGYVAGMDAAAKKTREVGTAAEKLAAKREALEGLGRPLIAIGVVAAASVAIAVKKFAEFDAAISNVKAVTQESTANMNALRDAALDAGGATIYTATEAANAIEELGKAGISTADILGGALAGSLSLAASGQLEVARAAEITATTLKQYNLAGSEAGRVADVLSAGAGKALGSVEDLAQGLKFVGPVAASMGISLEETVAALSMFADQGLIGEQAGTSLRGVLSSLTSPSKEAAKEIEALGINLYDAQGGFIGLEGLAGKLGTAYQKMDDKTRDASLGIIFGNQQVTAARVLFQGGAQAIAGYTEAVQDSGYASRIAADRMNNLQGDVEKLGGAFDTFLIGSGSSANDVLRGTTQALTFLLDAAAGLPAPVQEAGLAVVGVGSAIAITGGAALIAVPKIAAFRTQLATMGVSGKSAAVGIAAAGAAVSVVTYALSVMIDAAARSAAQTDALAESFDKTTGAATDYTRELVAKSLAETGAFAAAEKAGISQRELTDALVEGGDRLNDVKSRIVGYVNVLPVWNDRTKTVTTEQQKLIESLAVAQMELDGAGSKFDDVTAATDENAGSTASAAEAYQTAADKAGELQSNLNSLIDTINKANGVGQDAVTSNASYRQALADSAQAVADFAEANGISAENINESTAAGSENAAMFADLAQKSQDAARAQFDLDGNVDNYIATLGGGRQALYDQILGLTGSADAAQLLTDKIYAIPTSAEVEIIAETGEAKRRLDEINLALAQLPKSNRITIGVNQAFASGGTVMGGGTSKSDSVVIRASVGEEIIQEPHASRFRSQLKAMNAGQMPKFASGGTVYAPASYAPSAGVRAGATVQVDVTGVDSAAAAELVYQRLRAGLAA